MRASAGWSLGFGDFLMALVELDLSVSAGLLGWNTKLGLCSCGVMSCLGHGPLG
ncbi:hypothetical protein BDW42DRAFT_179003 [Aspergillus taichungensis]|uniref:Uncharacterized protein n=1 Tax=Aspergillus taichungensis TaxID=482145 RepID=A0A2J5HHJ6_9EURO|nr:hypothetical protein BDW42DRAFT_179003 [Aspergillus taichungensis]